jgi:VTC domain
MFGELSNLKDEKIGQSVELFEKISLKDSARAALMERSEAKFMCHTDDLLDMMPVLCENYYVLEIKNCCIMDYRSLYFDTPDFGLYMNHHNGKPNRYKVRYRHYLSTDTIFFEVKVRQKSKTSKERILIEKNSSWERNIPVEFFRAQRPLEKRAIEPKLEVWCQRITLVGKESSERLTIDLNLAYGRPNGITEVSFSNAVILELKYSEKKTIFTPIAHQFHLRGQRFSKYSVGCGFIYSNLKSNAFKPQRRSIERIENNG